MKLVETVKNKISNNMYFKIFVDLKSNRIKLNNLIFFFFLWNNIRNLISIYRSGNIDRLDKKDYSAIMVIISCIYFVNSKFA